MNTLVRKNLLPKDGEVYLIKNFFTQSESNNLFTALYQSIEWRQETIKLFGKNTLQPRLSAWHGDMGKNYTYSGITLTPKQWIKELLQIKNKIQAISITNFNSALLNLYRNGQDSMGWHRDNEKELGLKPIIGSVSFGATRTFRFQHTKDKNLKVRVDLEPGSYIQMQGDTQINWKHCLPKQIKCNNPRLNITFRYIY